MASIFGILDSGIRVVVLGLKGIEPSKGELWRREKGRSLHALMLGTGNNEKKKEAPQKNNVVSQGDDYRNLSL